MLTLISPAKRLLPFSTPYAGNTTQPLFLEKTAVLAQIMKTKSVADIKKLMQLSDELAQLNYHRYQNFALKKNSTAYPALFLFQGDVYQGLQANSWDKNTLDFAQKHLGIIPGYMVF